MKKNYYAGTPNPKKVPKLLLRTMKIFVGLSFLVIFQVKAANSFAQAKISIEAENITLDQFFTELRKQTGDIFVFSNTDVDVDRKIAVHSSGEPLTELLDRVLDDFELDYSIVNDYIVIFNRQQPRAAQHTVAGRITGEDDMPLIGVSVVLKGTNHGVATDAQGHYQLTYAGTGGTLVVSYIGYKKEEVPINGRSVINITLTPDVISIGDVVVTGYQSIPRDRASGSFDVITREQLSKPTSDIGSRLVGTVTGLQATTDIDGNMSFEIRGLSTLGTSNNQPLLVVDGFPIEGDLSSINPNDVESITLLKDASAASIWGARSANGVISVVTRSGAGAKNGTTVEFNAYYKVAPKIDLDYARNLATSAQTIQYEKLAYNAWSADPIQDGFNYHGAFSPGLVALNENFLGYMSDQEMNALLDKYSKLDNSSQIKKYLLQHAAEQQYNLNISGKNDRLTQNLSMLYQRNAYYAKGNDSWKAMVNYRTTVKMFKWLDFNLNSSFTYNQQTNNSVGYGGLAPYEMLVDEQGNRTNISNGLYWPNMTRNVGDDMSLFPYSDWTYNPITEMENRDLKTTYLNARLQARLTFKIMDGLDVTSSIQYEFNNSQAKNYYNDKTYTVRYGVNTASTYDRTNHTVTANLPKGGYLDQARTRTDNWIQRNQLNFSRNFGDHDVIVAAGVEISERTYQKFNYPRAYGYNDDTLSTSGFPNGPGASSDATGKRIRNWVGSYVTFPYTNSFSYSTDRYFSLYANASYTFRNRYTLTGSIRTDASNLITDDPSYRYAPFWSVGGSWQLGREKFMEDAEWVNALTVRATYGFNGNVDKTTSFKPLINMGTAVNSYTQNFTASISSYGNPDLRWERTGTVNIAVDYTLFNQKLYGKFEFYNKKSEDLIATVSIPAINGTTSQKLNNAAMRNTGFEFEVGTRQNIKGRDIVWQGNLTVSYNKNKITDLFVSQYQGYSLIGYSGRTATYVEGYDAHGLWSYQYNGVVNTGTSENPNLQPTIVGPTDADGNPSYFTYASWPTGDGRDFCTYAGTQTAPWIIGFNHNFKIYDFDLSFIMVGKFGHKFRRTGFNYPVVWGSRVLPNARIDEVLSADGQLRDGSKYVPLPLNGPVESRFYFWDRFYPYMDYLVENAGHFRMQEINLTYNMPSRIVRRLGLDTVQIYGQVNNVFSVYFNKYNEDPEYPLGSMKPTAQFTFGLKLTF